MKNVLVLGAGMVAPPLVRYFLARPDLAVTVADVDGARAAALVSGSAHGRSLALDVRDLAAVGALVDEADLVVSLLPPEFEPAVCRLAVERYTDVVSASPRGEAGMDELDDPGEHGRVRLGRHSMAEVQDMGRSAAATVEDVAHMSLESVR